MTKKIIFLLLIFSPISAFSQETPALSYQSTMIGWGLGSVYDTYLSPLKYSGNNIAMYGEQMKMTRLANGKIAVQNLYSVNYSWTKNGSETASFYSGLFEYNYGLLYKFSPTPKFRFFAGPQANFLLGFVYNNRNGNNPATGKLNLNLNISAIASYEFYVKSLPLRLGYQIAVPFAGIMYSPEFGQSYYEISLGDNAQLANFSSFHNHLAIKNILTIEAPIVKSLTVKLGFVHSHYETRINSLDTRISSATFCLGLTKNFFIVPANKIKNYHYVFE